MIRCADCMFKVANVSSLDKICLNLDPGYTENTKAVSLNESSYQAEKLPALRAKVGGRKFEHFLYFFVQSANAFPMKRSQFKNTGSADRGQAGNSFETSYDLNSLWNSLRVISIIEIPDLSGIIQYPIGMQPPFMLPVSRM